MDRRHKEEQIKDNMERAIARADKKHFESQGELPESVKKKHRDEFLKAARRVDKTKLHEMWNDKT